MPADRQPLSTPSVLVGPVPDAAGRTVLLVEDDDEHRFVYGRLLRAGGYTVAEAKTGPGGLEEAVRLHPSAIVVDIGLPGFDGWELTRRLKSSGDTRDIPVIAVTVHSFPGDRETSAASGCAVHLDKPARPSEVLDAVDRLLGVARESRGARESREAEPRRER